MATQRSAGKKVQGQDKSDEAKRRLAKFTNVERLKVLLRSGVDGKTLRRWERGEEVKPVTSRRIVQAMKELGVELLRA